MFLVSHGIKCRLIFYLELSGQFDIRNLAQFGKI
jgi:hypothetical protein